MDGTEDPVSRMLTPLVEDFWKLENVRDGCQNEKKLHRQCKTLPVSNKQSGHINSIGRDLLYPEKKRARKTKWV
eukprot:883514-Pelagomonas_calceolata.AAC.4